MSYISSIPREQLMLPCSIDGYVSSDHIVRFIDAFVDYNVQTTVDNDSHFIMTCEVTDNPNDYHSLIAERRENG